MTFQSEWPKTLHAGKTVAQGTLRSSSLQDLPGDRSGYPERLGLRCTAACITQAPMHVTRVFNMLLQSIVHAIQRGETDLIHKGQVLLGYAINWCIALPTQPISPPPSIETTYFHCLERMLLLSWSELNLNSNALRPSPFPPLPRWTVHH